MKADFFSTRRVLGSFGLVVFALTCALLASSHIDLSEQAGRQPGAPQGEPRSSAAQPRGDRRHLEFDTPEDIATITGFMVGYFEPGEKSPAFTFDVPRSRVASRKGTTRLPLIVGPLPVGQKFEIRLQSVAGDKRSAWSEPSGVFTVPDPKSASRAASAPVAGAAPRNRVARSAVAALERDPALQARLAAEFPNVDLAKLAADYRNLLDLASDLYAAANLKVPFADLQALTSQGRRDLRKAIATLKPEADANAEQRRARNQARTILRGPRK